MESDARRSEAADLLEMKRGMSRVALQKIETAIGKMSNRRGKRTIY